MSKWHEEMRYEAISKIDELMKPTQQESLNEAFLMITGKTISEIYEMRAQAQAAGKSPTRLLIPSMRIFDLQLQFDNVDETTLAE